MITSLINLTSGLLSKTLIFSSQGKINKQMDFHYSKPFGSYRLVTCLSKRKIHSYHVNENRNEIILVKWSNGSFNYYHMCPAYYRCRFRAHWNVDEYREKYREDLEDNMLRPTFTERFSKDYSKKKYLERIRRINHLAMLKNRKGGYTFVIGERTSCS